MAKDKIKSESALLSDVIYLRNPFTNITAPGTRRYLIFLISGNPGLIEYYRPFLSYLYAQLSKKHGDDKVVFEVFGRSLGGFELNSGARKGVGRRKPKKVYDLKEQIDYVESGLLDCVAQLANGPQGKRPKVILIGHSVGAYILMELLHRHRSRLEQQSVAGATVANLKSEPEMIGGICLFPTVVHIGKSEKGKILSALSKVPFFPLVAASLAGILTALVPYQVLRAIVSPVTGFQGRPLDTTTAFIKSKYGVYQALYMGCDEMRQITVDKWDADVWGAVHPSPTNVPRPKLFFYFGENDHWVADHTRDDLMRCRGRGESDDGWRPWMEIDKLEVPHGFCINHSIPVGDKVKEYVDTIVRLDLDEADLGSSKRWSLASKRLSTAQEGAGTTE